MDTPLSADFNLSEFQHDAPVPSDCLPALGILCIEILEPVRQHFDTPMEITSGYRPEASNVQAHGQQNSEHIYRPGVCAADFYCPDLQAIRQVFDWMRLNPSLPYHQLILEHADDGSTVIHCSYNQFMPGVRSVLEGKTNNESAYTKIDHVDYVPPSAVETS